MNGRRSQLVGASVRPARAWDWEADELSADDRAELERLRADREQLVARLVELDASVEAAVAREESLREALRRLAAAGWRRRRAVAAELRAAGLLDG